VLAATAAEIFIVDVPEPGAGIEEGLKLTVTPRGIPDADKETPELKPLEPVVVIVELLDLFQTTLSEVGDALRLKSP